MPIRVNRQQERKSAALLARIFGIRPSRGHREWCHRCHRYSALYDRQRGRIRCLRCGISSGDITQGVSYVE